MKIVDLRLSFLQFECLAHPLRALHAPAIPFRFLLSGPDYQEHIARLTTSSRQCLPASWDRASYGKRFWDYYAHHVLPTPKELWRTMVPLSYEAGELITSDWLNGEINSRTYLYPWGVGIVVDIGARGSMTLDEAVQLGFQVERLKRYKISSDGKEQLVPLRTLFGVLLNAIRAKVYGPAITPGQTGEMISIVTVLDATDADATQPPAEGGDLHHAMEGMVNWNVLYKATAPKKLDESKIEIRLSPPSHILYGGRRGRFVWFPGSFRSNAVAYPDTLICYHQNLTVATLQTESLCCMAKETADQLNERQSLATTSVAYQTCAQLAAGLLGRLYGGKDTYRSYSVRDQIAKNYSTEVNEVRRYHKMSDLA